MPNRFLFWTATGSLAVCGVRCAVGQAMPCQIIKMTMAPLLLGCMEFYDLWVRSGSQESNDERRATMGGRGAGRGHFSCLLAPLLFAILGFLFYFFYFFVCVKVAPQQLLHFLWHCHWCSCRSACWPFDKWVLHFSPALEGGGHWVMSRCEGARIRKDAMMTFSTAAAAASICQVAANWSDSRVVAPATNAQQITSVNTPTALTAPPTAFQLANAIKLPLPEPPAYPFREVCQIPLSDLQQKRLSLIYAFEIWSSRKAPAPNFNLASLSPPRAWNYSWFRKSLQRGSSTSTIINLDESV